MLPDRVFFIMTAIVTLAEIFAVCYFWERKMRQAAEAETRRMLRRMRMEKDRIERLCRASSYINRL